MNRFLLILLVASLATSGSLSCTQTPSLAPSQPSTTVPTPTLTPTPIPPPAPTSAPSPAPPPESAPTPSPALTPSPAPTPVPSPEPEETKEEESLAPEPEEIETSEPTPSQKQAPSPREHQVFEIDYLKPGGPVGASFSISNILNKEEVSGFVEVNDQESHNTDYSYDCYLEVLNPDGKTIYSWKGNYESDSSHRFDFDAVDRGKYVISFTHHSLYPKILYLKVSPRGWRTCER